MNEHPRLSPRLSPRLTYVRLLGSLIHPRPTRLLSLPPVALSRQARTPGNPRDSDDRDFARNIVLFITGEIVFGVGLAAAMLWIVRFLLP